MPNARRPSRTACSTCPVSAIRRRRTGHAAAVHSGPGLHEIRQGIAVSADDTNRAGNGAARRCPASAGNFVGGETGHALPGLRRSRVLDPRKGIAPVPGRPRSTGRSARPVARGSAWSRLPKNLRLATVLARTRRAGSCACSAQRVEPERGGARGVGIEPGVALVQGRGGQDRVPAGVRPGRRRRPAVPYGRTGTRFPRAHGRHLPPSGRSRTICTRQLQRPVGSAGRRGKTRRVTVGIERRGRPAEPSARARASPPSPARRPARRRNRRAARGSLRTRRCGRFARPAPRDQQPTSPAAGVHGARRPRHGASPRRPPPRNPSATASKGVRARLASVRPPGQQRQQTKGRGDPRLEREQQPVALGMDRHGLRARGLPVLRKNEARRSRGRCRSAGNRGRSGGDPGRFSRRSSLPMTSGRRPRPPEQRATGRERQRGRVRAAQQAVAHLAAGNHEQDAAASSRPRNDTTTRRSRWRRPSPASQSDDAQQQKDDAGARGRIKSQSRHAHRHPPPPAFRSTQRPSRSTTASIPSATRLPVQRNVAVWLRLGKNPNSDGPSRSQVPAGFLRVDGQRGVDPGRQRGGQRQRQQPARAERLREREQPRQQRDASSDQPEHGERGRDADRARHDDGRRRVERLPPGGLRDGVLGQQGQRAQPATAAAASHNRHSTFTRGGKATIAVPAHTRNTPSEPCAGLPRGTTAAAAPPSNSAWANGASGLTGTDDPAGRGRRERERADGRQAAAGPRRENPWGGIGPR